MNYRTFGSTTLQVSEIGFGAWAIGGPAMAGDMPIGWGDADDATSIAALKRAFELGINFYDTADFYGLGHSEKLIGQVFGNRPDVIIASKVGQRLSDDGKVFLDYTKEYILQACEESLRRLQRESIDFYQLHVARMHHLEDGACIEAMEQLQQQGKIRFWGISLVTFAPEPEGEFFFQHQIGHGFQVVLNLINQRSLPVVREAGKRGYGIIARMPLQFGLLAGKFTPDTRFDETDHRSFRLTPPILKASLDALEPVWEIGNKYGLSEAELALSFILSFPEVSTVIPGIRTPGQAEKNARGLVQLSYADREFLEGLYQKPNFQELMTMMLQAG